MSRYRRQRFDEKIRDCLAALVDAQDAVHHAERQTASLLRGGSDAGTRLTGTTSNLTTTEHAAAIHEDFLDSRYDELVRIATDLGRFAGRCRGYVGADAPTDPQPQAGTCDNDACWDDAQKDRSRCRACREYLRRNGTERPAELIEAARERKVYRAS